MSYCIQGKMHEAAYLLTEIGKPGASEALSTLQSPLHKGLANPLAWVFCKASYCGA